MKIGVIGAGIGGLAVAVRLAAAGHRVTVLEQSDAPGGKARRVELDGYVFDAGPTLLTQPRILADLFADTGAPIDEELELMRVEPITQYRFADGTQVEVGGDLPATLDALESWSPGTGVDWIRFLGAAGEMWRAAEPFVNAPPPWPPRRPRPGQQLLSPVDLARARPWRTLRGLAKTHSRDPRLQWMIERFATHAGADPRRAPAALATAAYAEHAFGAWHVRGGLYSIVEALVRRLEQLGGELRLSTPARRVDASAGRVTAIETDEGRLAVDAVVSDADALALYRDLLAGPGQGSVLAAEGRNELQAERSLSAFALMLALRGRTAGVAHHTILFPRNPDAELNDVFVRRQPAGEPTLYLCSSCVSDPTQAPSDGENWFVLASAPTHGEAIDWDLHARAYEDLVLERLAMAGLDPRDRIVASKRFTPADLERRTGALGGAIYGAAPHGRLATLRRPGNVSRAANGLYLVGGTVHPGGGLAQVMLGAKIVADEVGPADL
jgi:phytoene desaturase